MISALLTRLTRWYFDRYLAPLVDKRVRGVLAQQRATPPKKQYIGDLN